MARNTRIVCELLKLSCDWLSRQQTTVETTNNRKASPQESLRLFLFRLEFIVNLLRRKTGLWFEAIQFVGRRTVLSTMLAWYSRTSTHIRTRTGSGSKRMCGNSVSYMSSQRRWNIRILNVILCQWSRLKRFPWLAYSKYLDGAFYLPCVSFGVQCGRNTDKLEKLYKSPLTLTLWTSASSRFTKHGSGKCEMHSPSPSPQERVSAYEQHTILGVPHVFADFSLILDRTLLHLQATALFTSCYGFLLF